MNDTTRDLDTGTQAAATGPFHATALQFAAVAAVQAHWEALRAGRIAPARTEVDPRPIADSLPMLFVAEFVAPGHARLRLCGQHLGDLLGMEPRGMPLSVFIEPDHRADLADALQQVATGARVLLPLRAAPGFARPAIDGMLALMPLTDAEGRIARVLGVLESHGPVGRAPRTFTLRAPLKAGVDTTPPRRGKPVLRVIAGGLS